MYTLSFLVEISIEEKFTGFWGKGWRKEYFFTQQRFVRSLISPLSSNFESKDYQHCCTLMILRKGGRGKVFVFNFNSSCLSSPLHILCDVSVSNLGELWSQKGISICQFLGVEEKTLSANHSYAHHIFSKSEVSLVPAQLVCVFHCRPVTCIVSPLASQHPAQIAAYCSGFQKKPERKILDLVLRYVNPQRCRKPPNLFQSP